MALKLPRTQVLTGLSNYRRRQAGVPSAEDLEGFRISQNLAFRGVYEVSQLVETGWSERRCADLLDMWFRDHGVTSFFHKSFVWIGERTRFDGVRTPGDFLPSSRVLLEDEVFILDVAPIVGGYPSDVGVTFVHGESKELAMAAKFLGILRMEIPRLFRLGITGQEIWLRVHQMILDSGFDNIHQMYPFGVLGHRVHKYPEAGSKFALMQFGWQAAWGLMSRGVKSQLLNRNHTESLDGLWAVEPHLGCQDFGVKFEEFLLVNGDEVEWLRG